MRAFITFFMNKYRYPFKLSLTYMYIKPSLSKYFFKMRRYRNISDEIIYLPCLCSDTRNSVYATYRIDLPWQRVDRFSWKVHVVPGGHRREPDAGLCHVDRRNWSGCTNPLGTYSSCLEHNGGPLSENMK